MAGYRITDRLRCDWANSSVSMAQYHDEEWGTPLHDDNKLFEFLLLETMQAGLSWSTVLNRRNEFKRAFMDYDIQRLASLNEDQVNIWMADPSIIRNRSKLAAVISNARAFQKIQSEFGSFDEYQWGFVDGIPVIGDYASITEIPATTEISIRFGKDLKRRGFSFIGPTTCYAHMQATGMVDDHVSSCWRRTEPLIV